MTKRMLIDAAHPEQTRVAVVDGTRVEEFDFESQNKRQLRGNIYLAKVTRVEASLQAAFVDYGGNRHGFLAFNEIHPDYYQIPVADKAKLLEAEAAEAQEAEADEADAETPDEDDPDHDHDASTAEEAEIAAEEIKQREKRRRKNYRRYKIQEVIKHGQIMLIQVVKEERGTKGAALTSYMSLAGRYCVLMPNTAKGGGISRKIANAADRKRLKSITSELSIATGMGLIIRTAGAKRNKTEIKRDYDYLSRLWNTIRDNTKNSTAPALIHEEGGLVRRAVRDLYDKDIESIQVEGDAAYQDAKEFMKMLMPSHTDKVVHYQEKYPIFLRYKVEDQLETIHSPEVQLKSGGYLVIHQTEALVAIDVNSGKATRERNIEATAVKTNLEAAEESCRQMRLRDLAGLIVIDFIDMEENKNNRAVEKRMKDSLKRDRARVQAGRISMFGLFEMSRQRRRASVIEGTSQSCPTCNGLGVVRSIESSALQALQALESEGMKNRAKLIKLTAPTEVALYILNEKRAHLAEIESQSDTRIMVETNPDMTPPMHEVEALELIPGGGKTKADSNEEPGNRKKRRGRKPKKPAVTTEPVVENQTEEKENTEPKKGRRRGRRGGRSRTRPEAEQTPTQTPDTPNTADTPETEAKPATKRRVRRTRKSADSTEAPTATEPVQEVVEETAEKPSRPKRTRRSRRKKTDEPVQADVAKATAETVETVKDERPKRRVRKRPASKEQVKPADEKPAKPAKKTPVKATEAKPKATTAKRTVRKRPSAATKAAKPAETAKKAAPVAKKPTPRKPAAKAKTDTAKTKASAKPVDTPKPEIKTAATKKSKRSWRSRIFGADTDE
ncbi:Ribonuclease E [hydrothermal vent metagenome]|uniref:Ribonuclease E n=1 Tax=hydrothermal vent metagenome TaxID=652676 RepID=A0A3B0RPI9_9ZZZZ